MFAFILTLTYSTINQNKIKKKPLPSIMNK